MSYYYVDCRQEFYDVCKFIGMTDKEITSVLALPVKNTWHRVGARNNADVLGNWFTKELNRNGDKKRDSKRRCDLYKQRRNMINPVDMKKLREISIRTCPVSGHPINYGLGETKKIYDRYYLKKYGKIGISPSIERVDPDGDYEINNIEIISSFENVGRNMKVDTEHMRNVRAMYISSATKIPSLQEVKQMLESAECDIQFEKIDGSIRNMTATTSADIVPITHQSSQERNENNIVVWDLEKNAWRSFSYSRLKNISTKQ
jgi:hypothetical protein